MKNQIFGVWNVHIPFRLFLLLFSRLHFNESHFMVHNSGVWRWIKYLRTQHTACKRTHTKRPQIIIRKNKMNQIKSTEAIAKKISWKANLVWLFITCVWFFTTIFNRIPDLDLGRDSGFNWFCLNFPFSVNNLTVFFICLDFPWDTISWIRELENMFLPSEMAIWTKNHFKIVI